ncbi:hypothetical protein EDEG_00926 [Edhazardia aedis USNM 41457]|uniref:Uncharacterized protein n=1 Tax=Edhazardia aedis (strain USNM 41457) TaxID=1003232 RepID=J8ZZ14_EDHAE|nr:hypothetical protein EDEG_00926 [Edhazardia aedis USNM 41457]|eukprot:EJW04933.1 hypothetical protein EDEG_00926 [Edhazardia aedis USNM 41457]
MIQKAIETFDKFLQCQDDISIFKSNSYIRLNMLYFSPFCIRSFYEKLLSMGLIRWSATTTSIIFQFETSKQSFIDNSVDISKLPPTFDVIFEGQFSIYIELNDSAKSKENNKYEDFKIYSIELDFEPSVSHKDFYNILYEIESFLKGLDAVFFMCTEDSIDQEIMNNPLSNSIDFMFKRIQNKRKNI